MRSRWPNLMLLCLLASLLVPGMASASTGSGAESRVWALDRADQVGVGLERSLTLELHSGCELAYDELASDSFLAAKGAARSLDDLSAAGRVADKGGLTRAGRAYQKHMGRLELPTVPGKQLDQAGQGLLDDILNNPGTTVHPVTSGNAAGGSPFIGPNGFGATFGPDGSLGYFGRY